MSSTDCARVVAETLVQQGMREIVLCPGSRSAPLAYALHALAEAGRLRLHVRIDERSAGFLALGLAKAGVGPVGVVTTSGTAVGNLMPAVMEAAHSELPLVVLSADRPDAMRDTGANQTTDQFRLFAGFVRASAQISSADGGPRAWSHQVVRLLAAAVGVRSHHRGPVQLNLGFGEPLTPQPGDWPQVARRGVTELAVAGRPEQLPAARTVLLLGDCEVEVGRQAAENAVSQGIPVLSEPSGNGRHLGMRCYRLLVETSLGDRISRVIVVGHPTLSRPVARLLSRTDVETIVVTGNDRWHDPGLAVDRVVSTFPECGGSGGAPGEAEWLDQWREADARLGELLDERLADSSSGPAVAGVVARSLGAGDCLVVGSSNPVRDLDLAAFPEPVAVFANRGLAGIDGTISTATGIALGTGRPTTVLLGDLTFLHDVGGLLAGPLEERVPLRIVVVNDDGGSIFATLEQGAAELAGPFERIFGTPHGADLSLLAQGFGWEHRSVNSLGELEAELGRPIDGRQVLEIRVDRGGRRELDGQIRGLVDRLAR